MTTPLLTTKLYIPPTRSDLVPRPRLIERLDASLDRKLTLISAPAGFGKTTLVSEWVHEYGQHIAWLSLDEGDNDPTRFLSYFAAALKTINEDIGETSLAILLSPQPPPIESILTILINEIATIPHPIILILNDYHVIEDQRIHNALIFLLDHLPENLHLVIITRTNPPLPLSRLRGHGQINEIRIADLRFTPDEVTNFLQQVMGLELSTGDITALEVRTEGWIVGLQLAALSMKGRKQSGDISSFVLDFTGSNRYIIDYLADEVLQQRPKGTRDFLLQTSILNRMSGPLCDAVRFGIDGTPSSSEGTAVTGQENSQAILESLEIANLFIVPLDDERRWYRYHHLFADLLRQRLRQAQPDLVPELHRRAAEWYEQNELTAEAVGHALTAEDFERAACLVEQIARELWKRGEVSRLLGWIDALPDDVMRSRPQLSISYAWALCLSRRLDEVEQYLRDAKLILSAGATDRRWLQQTQAEVPAETRRMMGEIAAIRSLVARSQGDLCRAEDLSHLALEFLPEDDQAIRAYVAVSLGHVYWMNNDLVAASQAYAKASAATDQTSGNFYMAMVGSYYLAKMQVVQGHLYQAEDICQQALQLVIERGEQRLPSGAIVNIGIAELQYERNDLAAALPYLVEAIEVGEQAGDHYLLQHAYVTLAQVKQAQGDIDRALGLIRKVERLVQTANMPWEVALMAARRARLWLVQGDLKAAASWAQDHDLKTDDLPAYLREFLYLTLARVLTAQEEMGQAVALLERLLQEAEAGGRMGRVIEILVLQALALQVGGNKDEALVTLEQALSLAEPEGHVRTFVDEGPPMLALLERLDIRDQRLRPYVDKLLLAFTDLVSFTPIESPISSPLSQLVEPLTEREIEVLHLIAAGLTNQEIAEKLVIALGTVKAHTASIYGKLGVNSRTQAVARAREIGFL